LLDVVTQTTSSISNRITVNSPLNLLINMYRRKQEKSQLPWTIIDCPSLLAHFDRIKILLFSHQLRLLITIQLLRDLDAVDIDKKVSTEVMSYLDSLAASQSDSLRFQSVVAPRKIRLPRRLRNQFILTPFTEAIVYHVTSTGSDNSPLEVWTENFGTLQLAAAFGVFRSSFM
jgi:hypothetical protein